MKTINKSVLTVILLLFCSISVYAQNADWTFMVYMAADNNLEAAGIDDFLEMSSAGSDNDVNIITLFDRNIGHSNSYDDWTDARRGIINTGDVPDTLWGESIGEVNMGNPQTLIDFAQWGMGNYPADRYALILWDHGSGWNKKTREDSLIFKAVCGDDTGDYLFMAELRNALNTIETNWQEPNLVGFDACLMGMIEVAYEIRQHANVMVGSEKTEPNDGWPYDTILPDLKANSAMNATSLGSTIVTRYYQSFGNSEILSAINLNSVASLVEKTNSFVQTLRNDWNSDMGICAAQAYAVMRAVKTAVTAEEHGTTWPGSHGLAIYFPEASGDFNANYNGGTIQFPNDTEWEEFLQNFYNSMGGSWVADARDNSQEYDVSSAAGCQCHHIDLYDFCEKIIDEASGIVWVDFSSEEVENGSFSNPYNTLSEAVTAAAAGNTICIKTGSSPETITVSKAVRILACDGNVVIGE